MKKGLYFLLNSFIILCIFSIDSYGQVLSAERLNGNPGNNSGFCELFPTCHQVCSITGQAIVAENQMLVYRSTSSGTWYIFPGSSGGTIIGSNTGDSVVVGQDNVVVSFWCFFR